MGSIRGWLLCAALLAVSLSTVVHGQDDVEDLSEDAVDIVEKAFLLVRHKIDTVELVQGKNTSVVVEIYNAGNRYPLPHLWPNCWFGTELAATLRNRCTEAFLLHFMISAIDCAALPRTSS